MLFNSLHYLIYFPVVATLHFAIPHRWRWLLLLLASYYFYMCWKIEYAGLLFLSTAIAYGTALGMDHSQNPRHRKTLLILCLICLVGILFSFKYFNFISENLKALFVKFHLPFNLPFFNVLLPIGISFYTFQKISYVVDVYNRNVAVERHFGVFAVYSCFFPQLVAGPIERAKNLLHQFYERHEFSYSRASSALKLILWGFFKKIVVADRLAVIVQAIYSDPHSFDGLPLLVATVFFAFQVYCDFSGYTDIAIGSARLLGFELMPNFRQPYFSPSIPEFWRRWHISLSSWFKEYVYIPLGGNRVAKWRWHYNLLLTFVISGLWHGANWTFVIWGALHGVYMIADSLVDSRRSALERRLTSAISRHTYNLFQILLTFTLVTIAWIPFRANSLSDSWYIFTHLFSGASEWLNLGSQSIKFRGLGINILDIFYSVLSIAVVISYDAVDERYGLWKVLQARTTAVRWMVCYVLLVLVLFFGPYNQAQNFIYFQF